MRGGGVGFGGGISISFGSCRVAFSLLSEAFVVSCDVAGVVLSCSPFFVIVLADPNLVMTAVLDRFCPDQRR